MKLLLMLFICILLLCYVLNLFVVVMLCVVCILVKVDDSEVLVVKKIREIREVIKDGVVVSVLFDKGV